MLLAISFLAATAGAQTNFIQGTLTTAAGSCVTAPVSTNHVTIATQGFGGAVFTLVQGGFAGTVSFFASGDGGTTWNPLSVTPSAGGTAVTTASNASGAWQANVSAYTHVCALLTTDTAGSITAKIHISTVSARAGGGGGGGSGGPVALSSLISATAANTLTNGTANQVWNWQDTNAGASFAFGETGASTGGTVTGLVNNQSILQASTQPGSTATPLWISQGTLSGAVAVPSLQVTSTWNLGTTQFQGIVENVTNTASLNTSRLLNLAVGGVSQFNVDVGGNVTSTSGSLTLNGGGITAATTVTANGNSSFIAGGTPAFRNSNSTGYSILTGGGDASTANTLGAIVIKGAAQIGTAANAAGGAAILEGGLTNNTAGTGNFGTVEVAVGALKGTAIAAAEDVVCAGNTAYAVTDCAITPQVNVIGIALGTGNPLGVVMEGTAPVSLDAALTALGDTVCLSTTTAGKGHDSGGQGACTTAGAQVGVIIQDTGTVQVGFTTTGSNGAPQIVTLSTTLPLVALHFR